MKKIHVRFLRPDCIKISRSGQEDLVITDLELQIDASLRDALTLSMQFQSFIIEYGIKVQLVILLFHTNDT